MWFGDSWNLSFIPSSSTASLGDLNQVISPLCFSILPSVKMGGVVLPPAQNPSVASEGKGQALLPSLMWHFHVWFDAGVPRPFPPRIRAPQQTPWGISVSPLPPAVPSTAGDVTLLLLHVSRTLARTWSSIWGRAIQLILLGNTMFSGSSVISPAVIGTYLMTWHGNLNMSAETKAERFVRAESPKFPFLLHKKLREN